MYKLTYDDLKLVVKNFGEITLYFSIIMLVPILIVLLQKEGTSSALGYFLPSMGGILFGFLVMKLFKTELKTNEPHAIATLILVWFLIPLVGAMPYYFHGIPLMDSYFESVSSLTTTGMAIVMDDMPMSLIFWRAFGSWIGGIGIIITALIGVIHYTGQAKMFEAEGSDIRIRPSIFQSVKNIWWIYSLLTVLGIILLIGAHMSLFDSVTLSMSAISTGPENSYNQIINLNSFPVELVLVVIMIMGALPFITHYKFTRGDLKAYFKDVQVWLFFIIATIGGFVILPKFMAIYGADAIRFSFLSAFSAMAGGMNFTTTVGWDNFTKMIFIILMFIGGTGGGTAGGIKVIRLWLLLKSMYWKAKEKVLPENTYFSRKVQGKSVESKEITTVYLFIILFFIFIVIGTTIISAVRPDYSTTDVLLEVTSAQSNVGFTTGITSQSAPLIVKLILAISMVLGRIEILPIIVSIGLLTNIRGWR